MSWIKTHTGKKFNYVNIDINSISIVDITASLSKEQRFAGHLKNSWTVGQHILLVRKLVELEKGSPNQKFIALHHDSAEAYMKDVPRPLKKLLNNYNDIYKKVEDAIGEKFNIILDPLDCLVSKSDLLASYIEDFLFSPNTDKNTQWTGFTKDSYEILSNLYNGELDIYIRKLMDKESEEIQEMLLNCHYNPKR